jgi:hypothetical protein
VYRLSIIIYVIFSVFILANIGLGVLADTNRFENSRGFGAFVRVLDLLNIFIIAYSAIIIKSFRRISNRIVFSLILWNFILFQALINGAKISILFGLIAVFFSLKLNGDLIKVSKKSLITTIGFGVLFMFAALTINMKNNGEDITRTAEHINGMPLVVERFVNRMVSNGNTAYLILPNNIIDKLKTDNIVIRIFTPIIGISQMSKILGYNAGDFSVGRQALLYHDSGVTVAGGPTSHFDFFSYVYLGSIGGGFFVVFLGALLGNLNGEIQKYSRRKYKNRFLTALYTTFWFRAVIVVVEPTVGIAYMFDALLIFFLFSCGVRLLTINKTSTHIN